MIATDDLAIDDTGTFSDKNAGSGKLVTITDLVLSGADAGNYLLDVVTLTAQAAITSKPVSVSGITAVDKVYDGNSDAALNYENVVYDGMIATDDLAIDGTGTFSDKNAGSGKLVTITDLVLSGADAGNYLLDVVTLTAQAAITSKPVSVSGITAVDKVYDGNSDATLNYENVVYDGMIATDDLDVDGRGSFDDRNAEAGKVVTVELILTGADAGNYVLDAATSTVYADIAPRNIILTAGSAWKYYDGTPLTDDSYTVSGDGFIAGEKLESVVVTGAQTNPGSSANVIKSYTLAAGTGPGNYIIVLQAGTLSVEVSSSAWTGLDPGPSTMNWNETAVVPAMLGGELAAGGVDGTWYTASYSTLVAEWEVKRTFRSVTGGWDLLLRNKTAFTRKAVLSDPLFSLDLPQRDVGSSVIGSRGEVIFKASLGSGYELFPESFSFTLDAERVPPDLQLTPRAVQIPEHFFDETPQDDFVGLGLRLEQITKLPMFKSDLELLLEEMTEA